MPLQGAASRAVCAVEPASLKVPLLEGRVRFGAGLPVPLQGAAAGCRCGVRFGAGLLVLLHGVAAVCCFRPTGGAACACRVLLSKGCLHLRNLGAATGYCGQSAVRGCKMSMAV